MGRKSQKAGQRSVCGFLGSKEVHSTQGFESGPEGRGRAGRQRWTPAIGGGGQQEGRGCAADGLLCALSSQYGALYLFFFMSI